MLCPARFQKVMDINMAVRNMRGDMGGGVEWASNGTPKYHPNTKVNHLFQRQAQTGWLVALISNFLTEAVVKQQKFHLF